MLSTLTYVAGFSASKDYATLFLAFKHEHAKHYDSAAAEAQAFKAFSENEDIIASHNSKNLAYKLGHNEYSDLSKDDFWTLHFKPGFEACRINFTLLFGFMEGSLCPAPASAPDPRC